MSAPDQPRQIQFEDLWSPVQRGEAEGATVMIDDGVRIEEYGSSLAKGLASIWGLGHLVGPYLVIDEEFEMPTEEKLLTEAWENVGKAMWSVLPPIEELVRAEHGQ